MIRALIAHACLALACLALPVSAETLNCTNPQTQIDMTQCAYQEWQVADGELNAAYGRLMDGLKVRDANLAAGEPKGAEVLRDAQRAWLTFRDKTCEVEGFAMRGGSAEPMVIASCKARLTWERITHLYRMLDAYGG
jgi:uncharacterized protein YecT (DUF1311 family)